MAAINQVRSDYQAAFNAADAAKVGSLFAENGAEYPANQPTRQGRAAIIAATEAMAKEGKFEIAVTATDTQVSGDWGIDVGTYRMTMTPAAGGAPMTVDGRYLVILHREADGWKVMHVMDNTPAPMMMPEAPAGTAPPAASPATP
jgi:uncharacterized protein (TIGR02246 family)